MEKDVRLVPFPQAEEQRVLEIRKMLEGHETPAIIRCYMENAGLGVSIIIFSKKPSAILLAVRRLEEVRRTKELIRWVVCPVRSPN